VTLAATVSASSDPMKDTLDNMAKYFDVNGGKFDPVYYDKLTECFAKDNDTILL
jgi:hypothetical protein